MLERLRYTPGADAVRAVRDMVKRLGFRARTVEHYYSGHRFKVRITDPMAELWYDKDWPALPEIKFLKRGRLGPGARVFDIGAHQAVVALILSRESREVVALEPSDHNFNVARMNRSMNSADNLVLIRAAISDRVGKIRFQSGLNGRVSWVGKAIPTLSLDSLTSRYGEPDVVLLDIEGFELTALRGASQTIRGRVDWCVEVHGAGELQSFGASPEEVVSIFRDAGYRLNCCLPNQDAVIEPLNRVPVGRFFLFATR